MFFRALKLILSEGVSPRLSCVQCAHISLCRVHCALSQHTWPPQRQALSRHEIFLSRQTFMSSLSRQRRIGPLLRHCFHVPTQGLPALSISGRDLIHGLNLVPKEPCGDREPPVATLVTQSQPQPCRDTKLLSRHGAENFYHARVPTTHVGLS